MNSVQTNKALKILIADDDPDDRQLTALAFKEAKLDYTIEFVKNGVELMELLQQLAAKGTDQFPELLLLDLNMPKKDGRIALKEIKSDPKFQKLNIIVFSTSISDEDQKYISALGVAKCVTKPCGFYELVELVKNITESLTSETY